MREDDHISISSGPISIPAQEAPPTAGKIRRRLAIAALIALLLAVGGIAIRILSGSKLAQWTQTQAIPTVATILPQRGGANQELVLPGDIQAFIEAQIRARVSGYIKSWQYDIGAHVQAGDVLAVIDAPELEQQLEQAKGELAKAEAHAQLAKLTSKRWAALRASTAVSQQSVDEKGGDVAAKNADVAAAQANVDRLKALKAFTQITAPFAGVVTVRNIDLGVLVSPGNAQQLFNVTDIHQMRVYVRVPQAYAARLHPGMTATLKLSQYPNRVFQAKLVATSSAIAEKSRTLLVQLLADNADGALLPGSYAEVHFKIGDDSTALRVPASALLFRDNQMNVATLGADNKVLLKRIGIERDLGAEIEVSSGILPTDRLIDNPIDTLADGDVVKIAEESREEHLAGAAARAKPGGK